MEQNFISDPFVKQLADEIARGDCVIFIGAGVSILAGLPSWKQLEEIMKKETGLKDDYGPLRTADVCKKFLGEANFFNLLEKQFKKNYKPTILHKQLAKLPTEIFITTNYDTLLEDAIKNERGQENLQVLKNNNMHKWRALREDKTNTWVLKIHGCVQNFPDNIVIGEQDYLEYEEKNSHVIDCLTNIFERKAILFIGYSLTDWNITQLLHNVIDKTKGYSSNKYFIGINTEKLLNSYFMDRFNLRIINIQVSSSNEIESRILLLLNQICERFEIPFWLIETFRSLGCNLKGSNLDTPLNLLFSGFDATVFIRLALRLEESLDVKIPLEQMVEPHLTIGKLIDIIKQNNLKKTLPNKWYSQ